MLLSFCAAGGLCPIATAPGEGGRGAPTHLDVLFYERDNRPRAQQDRRSPPLAVDPLPWGHLLACCTATWSDGHRDQEPEAAHTHTIPSSPTHARRMWMMSAGEMKSLMTCGGETMSLMTRGDETKLWAAAVATMSGDETTRKTMSLLTMMSLTTSGGEMRLWAEVEATMSGDDTTRTMSLMSDGEWNWSSASRGAR
eukprot:COSAG04_NODE_1995_length_5040_cov_3.803886_1_plen_196_part_10